MAADRSEGPVTALVYLGIVIDTMMGELRLPDSKLPKLKSNGELREYASAENWKSLIDLLNHACKVVHPGMSFLRRLIDLLHQTG